jgi:hypothetical protein
LHDSSPAAEPTQPYGGQLGARSVIIILKTSQFSSCPTVTLTITLVVLPRHLWYIAQDDLSLSGI